MHSNYPGIIYKSSYDDSDDDCILMRITKDFDFENRKKSWIKQVPQIRKFLKNREEELEMKIFRKQRRSISCPSRYAIAPTNQRLIWRVEGERPELVKIEARELFGFDSDEFNMKVYSHFTMAYDDRPLVSESILREIYLEDIGKLRRLPGQFYATRSVSNCFIEECRQIPEEDDCCFTFHNSCKLFKEAEIFEKTIMSEPISPKSENNNNVEKRSSGKKGNLRQRRRRYQNRGDAITEAEVNEFYRLLIENLDVCACPFVKDGRGEEKATLLELAYHANHRIMASHILSDFIWTTVKKMSPQDFRDVCAEWKEMFMMSGEIIKKVFDRMSRTGQNISDTGCHELRLELQNISTKETRKSKKWLENYQEWNCSCCYQ